MNIQWSRDEHGNLRPSDFTDSRPFVDLSTEPQRVTGYACSVCGELKRERYELDSSGRCDECRP